MHAVVKISGRQYKVSPNDLIKVSKLNAEPGEEVVISDVMLYSDGENLEIGAPFVNYAVKLEVVEHGRHKKVITRRFVRRGGMRRKRGHRQHYSQVRVKAIEQGS